MPLSTRPTRIEEEGYEMRFFDGYQHKEDGAIRFYDVKSKKTKFWVILIFVACCLMALIALFPDRKSVV